jgi:hypothetical protein
LLELAFYKGTAHHSLPFTGNTITLSLSNPIVGFIVSAVKEDKNADQSH